MNNDQSPSAKDIAIAALAEMYSVAGDPAKYQFTGSKPATQFKGTLELPPPNAQEVINQIRAVLSDTNPMDPPSVSSTYNPNSAVQEVTISGTVSPARKKEFEALIASADPELKETLSFKGEKAQAQGPTDEVTRPRDRTAHLQERTR